MWNNTRLVTILILLLCSIIIHPIMDNNNFTITALSNDKNTNTRNNEEWIIKEIDSSGGGSSQVYIDSNNNPHVLYYRNTDEKICYSFRNGSIWEIIELWDAGKGFMSLSLALDSYDKPHACFYDNILGALIYGYVGVNGWEFHTIESNQTELIQPYIVVDSNDHPHICFTNDTDFKYGVLKNEQWTIEIIDTGSGDVWSSIIQMDSDDNPNIVYYMGYQNNLKYLYKDINGWTYETVESSSDVWDDFSFSMDKWDIPHVCFLDLPNNELIYAVKPYLSWEINTILSYTGGTNPFLISMIGDTMGYSHVVYGVGSLNKPLEYAKYDGIQWTRSSISSSSGATAWPSIDIDNLDHLYISYYDAENDSMSIAYNQKSSDIYPPVLNDDLTDLPPVTGEEMVIRVNATDNIDVYEALAICRVDSEYYNRTMEKDGDGFWQTTVEIPLNALELEYSFVITDIVGNVLNSESEIVEVFDSIPPTAHASYSLVDPLLNQVLFNASKSSDNGIIVNYTWSFQPDGFLINGYGRELLYFFKDCGEYNITLTVLDRESNNDSTSFILMITDQSPPYPTIDYNHDYTVNPGHISVFENKSLNFSAQNSTDNEGITNFTWTLTLGVSVHKYFFGSNVTILFPEVGSYSLLLTVLDANGNSAESKLNITVRRKEDVDTTPLDLDGDGWNNTVEIQVGTDPMDNLSVPQDMDGDGIPDQLDSDIDGDGWNNTIEEEVGTDPFNNISVPPDMDEDDIPDSIDLDRDGDGVANVDDAYPDDEGRWEGPRTVEEVDGAVWWIVGVVFIALVLGLIVGAVLFRKRNSRDEYEIKDGAVDGLGRIGRDGGVEEEGNG